MSELNIDFNRIFGAKTYGRGKKYFQSRHVLMVSLDEKKHSLKGAVLGSGTHRYNVNITFWQDAPEEELIEGHCSCPVGYNCKHVCAVLLSAEKQYGTDTLNALIGIDDDDVIEGTYESFSEFEDELSNQLDNLKKALTLDDSPKAETLKEIISSMETLGISLEDLGWQDSSQNSQTMTGLSDPEKAKLKKQRTQWLKNLKRVTSQSQNSKIATSVKKQPGCLVYVLRFDRMGNTSVTLHLSRYLKKGGLGKLNSFYGAQSAIQTYNWPASVDDADQHIIKMAYIHNDMTPYGNGIRIRETHGVELLTKIIATGRCTFDEHSKQIIEQSNPTAGELRWLVDEQGLQQPALFSQQNDRLNLIPTTPPYYLKVNKEVAECGELTHLPDGEILQTLLQAPPLDNDGIEETQSAISSLFGSQPTSKNRSKKSSKKGSEKSAKGSQPTPIHLPKKIQTQFIEPQPVLMLSSHPIKPSGEIARANLLFSYDGHRIAFENPSDSITLPDNDEVIIPRQIQQEIQHTQALMPYLVPADTPNPDGLREGDLIIECAKDRYQQEWLQFITHVVPELEDDGWIVETEESFPFQFEPISDDDWYAELDESQMDWFTLKLGINIDGKPIDLLPLLARQIHQLPTPDELRKMPKDEQVPVALPGGRFINLPAERLQLIAGTLLELYGDRPQGEYRLQNHHADIWQELHDKLGLPWAGGDKLLELARKLKSFKRMKKVAPPKALQAELRPYQQDGLSWLQFLREYGLNGILADDMGLGKTLQTLSHLQVEKQRLGKKLPPSLVVCPTSLLHNWKNEAQRFTPELNVHIHHGSQRDSSQINNADLVLTSYGVIQRDFETLSKTNFHLLALDEAQAVKNPNAKSAQAVRSLNAAHKLCITGTPMENHLGELWSLYDFLMPGFLGARDQFTRFYRTPIEKHNNKQQSKKLQKRVAPFMLRRSKDLVAKELPPKTEIVRTTELNGKQRDLYETIRASMESRVKDEIEKKGLARSQIVILDALLKMRQACCDPSLVKLEQAKEVPESAKLDLLMSLVQPIVEEGRKILIFSQFTSMLSLIEERLNAVNIDWVKLTGQTRDRHRPIKAFQEGDVPVFLISLKAGGTGLNLTAADTVIHYDPWWNPAVEDQASDRSHRIGQDKPVFVYKLVTEGTVEEKIQELKEKKKNIAASLYGETNGKKKQSITAEDLNVLFEPLKAAEAQ
ncbi:DEAD/DEAH box helicase [Endozoicomonas montiporae]|uniref:SNF2 family DNA/RNA helicase n=1 Tax=Endozoicomonas montiporae CL-33 TaxID=570277 RepID=A0A142BAR5_9GAMM|nr:DEAD/DEAH box helicase [Endozoicomonas montiporae]AMO55841.1 SNF2 family DNA/RNA helicase [Endozoicomonas montiporae CL-33]